jgi:hypothetical protein
MKTFDEFGELSGGIRDTLVIDKMPRQGTFMDGRRILRVKPVWMREVALADVSPNPSLRAVNYENDVRLAWLIELDQVDVAKDRFPASHGP